MASMFGKESDSVILQFANPMSYYIFMTELIDLSQVTEEEPMVQRRPRCRLAGDARAFGQEPNALPQRCN
jgi:hypothetical protein